ncbi:EcsC family protein [Nocardioides sp. InS609-2]|uniref:EcsC family protein n=1 Tax=Nocardioides sp. InS609-2 TaxID=2760705 RepID=UPI0020BDE9B3|nr:EcsC family protein [Nocardioides sp. InS609-2]
MGLLDLFRSERDDVATTRSALDAAADPQSDDGAINKLVATLLNTGLDGVGPIASATEYAARASKSAGDAESAIDKVVRTTTMRGAAGGFVTGLGGFVTMPIALPVNVLEFYVQATRMVGAIASLRGYDVSDARVRTAVLLTLVGSDADDVLAKAGLTTGGGRVASMAFKRLPPPALMVVNKAVAFRLLRGVGGKLFSRLGRGVPVVGGVVGGGLDGWMMRRIAKQAREEFPAL